MPPFLDEDDSARISESLFLELAVIVRLAYLQDERAHFPRICNQIGKQGSDAQHQSLKRIRESWDEALQTCIGIARGGVVYGPKDILDAYFNGYLFHQDEGHQADLERLREVTPVTDFNFHFTVFRLAGCILSLDYLVADLLGEEPLIPAEQSKPPYLFRWVRADEYNPAEFETHRTK